MRLRLEIAADLKKTLAEIEALPVSEIQLWMARAQLIAKERRDARSEAGDDG